MANVRVKETVFGNPIKSIVKFPDHYVNTTAVLPASAATTDADGKKVIKAGTAVTLGETPAVCATGGKFDGVVFNDEYVAFGEEQVTVTVLIHGFVRKQAMVDQTATSNNSMIMLV